VAGERWQRGRARALSDEGDDPGLTDRVGPPISEREATAESTSGAGDGRNGRAAESDKRSKRRADWPDREGGGGPQLGWKKIREEAGPKIRKKEFLN
jgi:hypothetical protein